MSEVKRDICHACVSLPRETHCFVCDPELGCRKELDAQRLRADTAEAERDALKDEVGQVKGEYDRAVNKVAAAEQRIAELQTVLRSAVEWFDDGVGRSIDEFRMIQEMRAALNPNPEAESHE